MEKDQFCGLSMLFRIPDFFLEGNWRKQWTGFLFLFWLSLSLHCPVAGGILVQCRTLVPLRGFKPVSPALERGGVITTGPSKEVPGWVAFENQLECGGCSSISSTLLDRLSTGRCWGSDGHSGCTQPHVRAALLSETLATE